MWISSTKSKVLDDEPCGVIWNSTCFEFAELAGPVERFAVSCSECRW